VLEDGRYVATAGAFSFDLTLPGGITAPAAGVTWVGVLPTHRRRGILNAMMSHQLDDVAGRGEPFAVLTASEAAIYGRYGYGVASRWTDVEIDLRKSAFAVPFADTGRIRLVPKDEAKKIQPVLFDEYRRTRPGEVSRNDGFWELIFRDRQTHRDGASPHFHAIHENAAGEADGYARYRVKQNWDTGNIVHLVELVAHDQDVEAALFRYLFDIDLASKARLRRRPLDDPLQWRLHNWRAYETKAVHDWLWLRIVDVASGLAARRYETGGSLVLEVVDGFRPANAGTYRLEGGPDGATCERTDADADITLDVRALGAAFLGTVELRTLARAGLVTGAPDAIKRADALFASTPAPFCSTPF
jgi:predicted acetyltransferase